MLWITQLRVVIGLTSWIPVNSPMGFLLVGPAEKKWHLSLYMTRHHVLQNVLRLKEVEHLTIFIAVVYGELGSKRVFLFANKDF